MGTFLSNLLTSDKNAIYFALTGTPLIQKDVTTKEIFGDYIHKYFIMNLLLTALH